MLQPSDYTFNGKSNPATPNSNLNNQNKNISAPIEQATIGRTLVIKGELTAAEALYIDGRIEGKISLPDHRVTIGRNGSVQAN
ncbi:MAG: polymer-forming cytoskeletal protein, partial [Candidatus Sulfotelmatobacter sp.]